MYLLKKILMKIRKIFVILERFEINMVEVCYDSIYKQLE